MRNLVLLTGFLTLPVALGTGDLLMATIIVTLVVAGVIATS